MISHPLQQLLEYCEMPLEGIEGIHTLRSTETMPKFINGQQPSGGSLLAPKEHGLPATGMKMDGLGVSNCSGVQSSGPCPHVTKNPATVASDVLFPLAFLGQQQTWTQQLALPGLSISPSTLTESRANTEK